MKALKVVLSLMIAVALLTGCGSTGGKNSPPEAPPQPSQSQPQSQPDASAPVDFNVAGLKGPTGMALAQMKDSARNGTARHNYNVTFESAPDVVQGKLLSGEADIAALPTNLASVLYNKTGGELRMIALSRLSVLYVMQGPGEDIQSFADLAGKTLFTAGQGSTQEYVLDYLLRSSGVDPASDLRLEYKSEHGEVAALLLSGQCDAALLPQPFVTTVATQNPGITRALDINAQWDALTGGVELAMSCVVVRSSFMEEHPQALLDFLEDYAASARFAGDNVEEAAALIGEFEIIPEAVARQAIPYSGIDCVTGQDMKLAADAYLAVLFEQNPAAVGGVLPDDGFYFLP